MSEFSCRYCEDRYPGCHAHCETYKEEKAEHEEKKAEKRQRRQVDDYIIAQVCGRRDYSAKRRKKHPMRPGCIK